MIARFVLGCCSKVKDEEKRISIHVSPFYDDPRPETRKIRLRSHDNGRIFDRLKFRVVRGSVHTEPP